MAGYKFWFGCRQFESATPTLTMGEIVKMANASPHNHCAQDMFGQGQDRYYSHGERVDLRNEPHFYCYPPATMYHGGGWCNRISTEYSYLVSPKTGKPLLMRNPALAFA